jgi:methylmalonyl-CoA mutase cobalamin-binding domain/chain
VLALGGAFEAIEELKGRLVRSHAERMRKIESGRAHGGGRQPVHRDRAVAARRRRQHLEGRPGVQDAAIAELAEWRAQRDNDAVKRSLEELRRVARSGENIMPASIDLAHAGGTTGEWAAVLREEFGEYRAPTGVAAAAGAAGGSEGLRAVAERLQARAGGPPRFLVAKPGLDGHSNGAEQIAVAARDAGFEVIYQGIRLTPEQIAAVGRDEDVDVVGLSILSGSHLELVPEVVRLLRAEGVTAPVIAGGIIPEDDRPRLLAAGIAAVYTPKDFEIARIMGEIADLVEAHQVTLRDQIHHGTRRKPVNAAHFCRWSAHVRPTRPPGHDRRPPGLAFAVAAIVTQNALLVAVAGMLTVLVRGPGAHAARAPARALQGAHGPPGGGREARPGERPDGRPGRQVRGRGHRRPREAGAGDDGRARPAEDADANQATPPRRPTPTDLPAIDITDAETGVFSQVFFDASLGKRISAARRGLRPLTVAMLEVVERVGEPDMAHTAPEAGGRHLGGDPARGRHGGPHGLRRVRRAARGHPRERCDLDPRAHPTAHQRRPPRAAPSVPGMSCYPAYAFDAEQLVSQALDALDAAREWRQDRIEVTTASPE